MRKTITLAAALLLLLGAGTCLATTDYSKGKSGGSERGGGREQHPPMLPDSTQIEKMLDEMSDSLDLDDEQRARISVLTFEHFARVAEKMEGARGRGPDAREEMEALREDYEDAVKAILDEDQKAAFDEFRKRRTPPRGGPGPRARH